MPRAEAHKRRIDEVEAERMGGRRQDSRAEGRKQSWERVLKMPSKYGFTENDANKGAKAREDELAELRQKLDPTVRDILQAFLSAKMFPNVVVYDWALVIWGMHYVTFGAMWESHVEEEVSVSLLRSNGGYYLKVLADLHLVRWFSLSDGMELSSALNKETGLSVLFETQVRKEWVGPQLF